MVRYLVSAFPLADYRYIILGYYYSIGYSGCLLLIRLCSSTYNYKYVCGRFCRLWVTAQHGHITSSQPKMIGHLQRLIRHRRMAQVTTRITTQHSSPTPHLTAKLEMGEDKPSSIRIWHTIYTVGTRVWVGIHVTKQMARVTTRITTQHSSPTPHLASKLVMGEDKFFSIRIWTRKFNA